MVDSRRVVQTLCKHDPTFVQFAKNYIGTDDPAQIWDSLYTPNGFSKANPDQSDTHSQKPLGTPTVKPPAAPKPPKPVQAVKPPTQKKGALKPTKALSPKKPAPPKKGKTDRAPAASKPSAPPPKESSRTFGKGWRDTARTTKKVGKGTLMATGAGTVLYGAHKTGNWAKEKASGVRVLPGSQADYETTAKSDFSIIKYDDDKRQVFGWASVIEKDGQPVLDKQGDIIDPDEMEKSAYKFVLESRKGGHQHKRTDFDEPMHVSDMIESFALTDEKKDAMGLPKASPTGWWVGFKVNSDDTWDAVKNGKVTSFSIHGKGRREPVDE